jgi:hypothetical protein
VSVRRDEDEDEGSDEYGTRSTCLVSLHSYSSIIHPLRVGWRNLFSAVLEKFLQPINAPRVSGIYCKNLVGNTRRQ